MKDFLKRRIGLIFTVIVAILATAGIGVGTYIAVKNTDDAVEAVQMTESTTQKTDSGKKKSGKTDKTASVKKGKTKTDSGDKEKTKTKDKEKAGKKDEKQVGTTVPAEKIERKTDAKKVETDDGHLYSAQDGYIRQLAACGKNIAVLEDGCLTLLSPDGRILFCAPHSYVSPMIKCSRDRILLYDKASVAYRVFTKNGEKLSGKLDTGLHIVTGDISDSGSFALVASYDKSSSFLSVFSPDGDKELYRWKCSPEHIVSISLSPKGKNIAAGVLSASKGDITTKVYFLNTKMTESPKPYTFKSGAVIRLSFLSEKLLSVVTNEKRVILSNKNKVIGYSTSADFSGIRTVKNDEDGNTAVLCSDISGVDNQKIYVFNRRNAERFPFLSAKQTEDIAVGKGKTYILCAGSVQSYSKKGKLKQESEVNDRCCMLCVGEKGVFCASDREVYRVNL